MTMTSFFLGIFSVIGFFAVSLGLYTWYLVHKWIKDLNDAPEILCIDDDRTITISRSMLYPDRLVVKYTVCNNDTLVYFDLETGKLIESGSI